MEPNVVTSEMRESLLAFSKGTRACLGKGLAMMELKLVTSRLVRKFTCTLAPSMTDAIMEHTDHFLLIPAGGKCDLIFESVSRK